MPDRGAARPQYAETGSILFVVPPAAGLIQWRWVDGWRTDSHVMCL